MEKKKNEKLAEKSLYKYIDRSEKFGFVASGLLTAHQDLSPDQGEMNTDRHVRKAHFCDATPVETILLPRR